MQVGRQAFIVFQCTGEGFSLFIVCDRGCRCAIARSRWHWVTQRIEIGKSTVAKNWCSVLMAGDNPAKANPQSVGRIRVRRSCGWDFAGTGRLLDIVSAASVHGPTFLGEYMDCFRQAGKISTCPVLISWVLRFGSGVLMHILSLGTHITCKLMCAPYHPCRSTSGSVEQMIVIFRYADHGQLGVWHCFRDTCSVRMRHTTPVSCMFQKKTSYFGWERSARSHQFEYVRSGFLWTQVTTAWHECQILLGFTYVGFGSNDHF